MKKKYHPIANPLMSMNTDFDFLQRRRQGKIIPKKTPLSKEVKKSITWLLFTLVFLTVILSIVYLLNTTQSSQKGYSLKQEQIRKEQLELQKRQLVNQIIEAMSFNKIEESTIVEGMEKAENPIYIEESPE